MKIFFGIDGGGTSTRMRIEDEAGNMLHTASSVSSNIYAVGPDSAASCLENLISSGIKSAKAENAEIYGCIGSAGFGRKRECSMIGEKLKASFPSAHISLVTDGEILLAGALDMAPGIALIAGTGSLAIARDGNGNMHRAGGMGWRLGDEGSAWWIASEAIRRTLRSLEGRDISTGMLLPLLKHYKLSDPAEFITLVNSAETEKGYIASGARIVTDMAIRGDRLARDILGKGADELVLLVSSLTPFFAERKIPLVLYGGVLEHDEYIRALLSERLSILPVEITKPKHTALEGALMIARHSAGS